MALGFLKQTLRIMNNSNFLKKWFTNKRVLLLTLDSPFLDNSLVFPYLGILYLIASARRAGFEIHYINKSSKAVTKESFDHPALFYTDEFDMRHIDRYKDFDLICISCLTAQAHQAYSIRARLKEKYPHMKIMIGGAHIKGYLEDCIKEGFDIICAGDGERIFENILTGNTKALEKLLHPLSDMSTLVFQDKLAESEMNSFPIPLRQREYIGRYKYLLDNRPATTLVNSRGCCMRCEFCEDRLTGTRWHSLEHFKDEIESIISLGITAVMIFDDLFALDLKKVSPYLEILKSYREKYNLIFRCFGHAKTMSRFPEMAHMLADAGCVELGFGAETASQIMLDKIEKGTKVEELHNFVEISVKAGINVKAFFMIGLPGETRETFKQTHDFIRKHRKLYPGHFDFDLAVFFPYKGTKIGRIVRLPEGTAVKIDGKEYLREDILLRPALGLDWQRIDNGNFGAYKKKSGASDIVVETYDWPRKKVLLSSEEIYRLKEDTMALSGRYTDSEGKRIFTPSVEGNIGTVFHKEENICCKKS